MSGNSAAAVPGFGPMLILRRVSVRRAALLGVAAIALAACAGGSDDAGSAAPPPSSAESADVAATDGPPPAPGEQTPEAAELAALLSEAFATSTTIDGTTTFEGATLASGDSVVWFWAPWCTICRSEGPEVAEIAERYGSQVNIIGVPGRGQLDEMVEFVDDTGTGAMTHVADLDGAIWSAFGVYGQPAFAFIDDDGSVEVFIGGMGGDALAERIDELITT
jgi:thiol-disulfide isomerase/thioredoxin